MQMHVGVTLNLWGNVVVNMFFFVFLKSLQMQRSKLVPVRNLCLLKNAFSILHLRLSLKKCFQSKQKGQKL